MQDRQDAAREEKKEHASKEKDVVDKIKEISGIKSESKIKATEKIIEEDRKKLLVMSEISIWLDTYDDIFSDFDPRPYAQRSLSDDFLNETKKASREKPYDRLELRILIAENLRDSKTEGIIKKKLKDHFMKYSNILKKQLEKNIARSILLGFLGISSLFIATLIPENSFIQKFLVTAMEPTGWFMTWFALDNVFYSNKAKKEESVFYRKMAKCEIIFSSY